MKKTMFITSVIMVVVMAIALTTSSLAWFSAADGGEVGTNAVTISAKSSASQGLYIARGDYSWITGTIDLNTGATESYIPVVPYGSSAADTSANVLYALQHNRFVGNNQKTENATALFANNYFEGYEYVDDSETKAAYYKVEDLYVANSGNKDIKVKADISITSEDQNGAILYVAVLARHESAEYRKINGDLDSNGVLTGYIDANGNDTKDAGEVVYASHYELVTADNPATTDVDETAYANVLYIDTNKDGQITAMELNIDSNQDGQISAAENHTVAAYLTANSLTDSAIKGEKEGTESEAAFAARNYDEINTLKWELLSFANSRPANDGVPNNNLILGRYAAGGYRTVIENGVEKYVLSDNSKVAVVVKGENDDPTADPSTWETDEQFAIRKAAQIAELGESLVEVEGNTYFLENAPVAEAYDEDGVDSGFVSAQYAAKTADTTDAQTKTSFVLRGFAAGENVGDYMQVKVIAWYSNDLDNISSGAYDEENRPFGTTKSFTVTFSLAE